MKKTMNLELYLKGGGTISKELTYSGGSLEEIACLIDMDQNDLLEYMRTHDNKGSDCFCFCGFAFSKESIVAAQLSEPEF